ncbi:hypothetical protein FJ365_05300 [Candidatus Dependentiae bacterium]|nr:hypothetical protein [Candidatus Dependentiae bacterium]
MNKRVLLLLLSAAYAGAVKAAKNAAAGKTATHVPVGAAPRMVHSSSQKRMPAATVADGAGVLPKPRGIIARSKAFVAKVADKVDTVSFQSAEKLASNAAEELRILRKQFAATRSLPVASDFEVMRKLRIAEKTARKAHKRLVKANAAIQADPARTQEAKVKLAASANKTLDSIQTQVEKYNQLWVQDPLRPIKLTKLKNHRSAAETTLQQKKKIARMAVAVKNTTLAAANKAWKAIENSRVGRFFKTPERAAHIVAVLIAKQRILQRSNDGNFDIKAVKDQLFDILTQDLSPEQKKQIREKVDNEMRRREELENSHEQMNKQSGNGSKSKMGTLKGFGGISSQGKSEILEAVFAMPVELIFNFLGVVAHTLGAVVQVFGEGIGAVFEILN